MELAVQAGRQVEDDVMPRQVLFVCGKQTQFLSPKTTERIGSILQYLHLKQRVEQRLERAI